MLIGVVHKYLVLPKLLVVGILLLLVFAGCVDEKRKPGIPPESLTLLYTCDTQGHIEPCSCASGHEGGLARRMTYVSQNSKPTTLLVDAGDVAAGPREWELIELEYILMGCEMLNYDAINLGHRETSINPEKLKELSQRFAMLVSANIFDKSGELVAPPYRIVDLTDTYRVGILGVVDDTVGALLPHDDIVVSPPEDAIAKYLPELRKQADLIVLLAHANEERLKTLAEHFFEIDVIVGGDVMQPTNTPKQINKSVVVYNTDKGKAVGQLALSFPDGNLQVDSNEIFMLGDEVPGDPGLEALADELRMRLSDLDFRPHRDDEEGLTTITAVRSKDANTYVVPNQCQACHPSAYAAWEASAHANAYATLVEEKKQYNPDCLRCHTTGYGASDGYVNQRLTEHLAMVSCDDCHGRGQYHIKFHMGDDVPEKAAQLKKVGCTECHDDKNSPDFDYNSYWEKIRHALD